jgi:hypothetical protein
LPSCADADQAPDEEAYGLSLDLRQRVAEALEGGGVHRAEHSLFIDDEARSRERVEQLAKLWRKMHDRSQ